MPSDPNIILGIKPPAAPPDPLSMIGQLSQLRNQQADAALRTAQMQTANANTADIQQQTASRNRLNQSWAQASDILNDPAEQHKYGTGDMSSFQKAGIDPSVVDQLQKNQMAATASATAKNKADFEFDQQRLGKILEGITGLKQYAADNPDADLSATYAQWKNTANGALKLAPGTLPDSIAQVSDLDALATRTGVYQGVHDKVQADQANAQKIKTDAAAALKDTGQGNEAQAAADKTKLLAPGELTAQQTKNAQDARMLVGTSPTGVSAEEQIKNKVALGELTVKQGELAIKRETFQATVGSGLDVNGQPITPEALKASALLDPTAKAIADYQIQGPPAQTRSGMPSPLYRKVLAINPDYDGTQFAARNKTQSDFSPGGKTGQAITSSDTALSHLNSISLAGKALDSGDIKQLNRLATFVGAQIGTAAPTVYDSIVATVAPEISKAVIGGPGGEGERQQMAANFSRNLSPQAREGAVGANVGLISARVQKQRDAYQSQMGHALDRQLSPESQAVQQRYGAGSGSGTVNMRAPDGSIKPVAAADVAHYKSLGAVQVP